jgi:hypothetical protein
LDFRRYLVLLLRVPSRPIAPYAARADGSHFVPFLKADSTLSADALTSGFWRFSVTGVMAFVSGSPDGSSEVGFLRVSGGHLSPSPETQLADMVSVALSPSGDRAAVGGTGVAIWDVNPTTLTLTGEEIGFNATLLPGSTLDWQPRCTIAARASDETIHGTSGPDLICVHGSHDVIRGGAGRDVIFVIGHGNVVRGGRGNDVIVVHGGRNRILGGARVRPDQHSRSRQPPKHPPRRPGTNVCLHDAGDVLRGCS